MRHLSRHADALNQRAFFNFVAHTDHQFNDGDLSEVADVGDLDIQDCPTQSLGGYDCYYT